VGCIAALTSLALVTGGVAALVADGVARNDDGYVMSRTETFTSAGSAVLFSDLELDTTGASWVPDRVIGDVRITVSPGSAGDAVFFGIGPSRDVDAYLSGASYSVERGPGIDQREVVGPVDPGAPTAESFWVASATGGGSQQLTWEPRDGSWSAVLMNADGSSAVTAEVAIGATFPWLTQLGLGLLLGGVLLAVASAAIIVLAIRQVGSERRTS
jgi:hypothetical protein